MENTKKTADYYKVVMLTFPYCGHINPTSGLVHALSKARHRNGKAIKTIVYALDKYKHMLENAGGLYRSYTAFPDPPMASMRVSDTTEYAIASHFEQIIECGELNVDELVETMRDEQPDLIVYDKTAFFPVYVLAKLKQDYESGRSTYKPPPNAMFSTTFPVRRGDPYPNQIEEVLESWSTDGMDKIQEKHAALCKRLELSEHLQKMQVFDFYYIFTRDNLNIGKLRLIF